MYFTNLYSTLIFDLNKKRNGRVIYLLGTAHISSSSAQLAGNLVREVHPNGK